MNTIIEKLMPIISYLAMFGLGVTGIFLFFRVILKNKDVLFFKLFKSLFYLTLFALFVGVLVSFSTAYIEHLYKIDVSASNYLSVIIMFPIGLVLALIIEFIFIFRKKFILSYGVSLVSCIVFVTIIGVSFYGWKFLRSSSHYDDFINGIYQTGWGKYSEMNNENHDNESGVYKKNSIRVFFNDKLIPKADAETFVVLDNTYAKDARNTYYNGRIINEIDQGSFETLGGEYARDKNNVYYMDYRSKIKTNTADLEVISKSHSAVLIEGTNQYLSVSNFYAKTKDVVLYNGVAIEGADAATFTVIRGDIAKDKFNVYFGLHKSETSFDLESFEVLADIPEFIILFDVNGRYIIPSSESQNVDLRKFGYVYKEHFHLYNKYAEVLWGNKSKSPDDSIIFNNYYQMDSDFIYCQGNPCAKITTDVIKKISENKEVLKK